MTEIDVKFKELYCNNFNRIKNFANTYLRNEEIAISVTQDVFVSLLENKDSFTLDETLLPYIFVMAKNRCLNILRKEKAKRRYQKDKAYQFDVDIAYKSLNMQSFGNLDFQRLNEIYRQTLAELPEHTRETFLLSRDNNLKYKEIAERQNISVKMVEYQMMFALRVFRKKLKDYLIIIILFMV